MKKLAVILGAGNSGTGAAALALKKGYDVFLSDNNIIKPKFKEIISKYNISYEEGKHTKEKIISAGIVIKSPGIPDNIEIIKAIRDAKIPVISEIEFAALYTDAKKICITGSNGKTTTTCLLYDILRRAGLNAGIAGNVGNSFALEVAEKDYDYYVLELSSFQLDDMYGFKADIAILLNITPDHLDRYNFKFENYAESKFRITQNQTEKEFLIYCEDDAVIKAGIGKRKISSQLLPFSLEKEVKNGGYEKGNHLIINYNKNQFNMSIQELALQGRHNRYNSLAAGIAAYVLNIRKEPIRESLMNFQAVEHRLEKVLKIRGVEFINDSKATNVNSTWYALESMKHPVIWIVGGTDKGNDYSSIKELVREKVKAIVCLGIDNSKILKAFKDINVYKTETTGMADAVRASYNVAKTGDIVLLSPACASFDLFESYEDRGKQFKNAVRDL